MRKQTITLEIRYDEIKEDSPDGWDWASLFDCAPENVKVVSCSEPEPCLDDDDIEHCRETWEEIKDDEDAEDEEVMTSSVGYVLVCKDGEVISFGKVVHKFEE